MNNIEQVIGSWLILGQYEVEQSSSAIGEFFSGLGGIITSIGITGVILLVLGFVALLVMAMKFYRKVDQGQALVRNGLGGTKVSFDGMFIVPIMHRVEFMEISVKRVEITRISADGLICRDNMRADIKVAFFVRVNKTQEDVLKVAQSVGCKRASDEKMLEALFDAKFSEALKTVGRKFDFVDLYNARREFKDEILEQIGTDLNGYVLDDAAIDYLEQTKLEFLNPDNILDSEGIKKITDLTAKQKILANEIDREKEKIITQQDVEAREAVLELNKQLAEAEQKQQREIAAITAREQAEAKTVQEKERQKSELARIATDEEVQIAEENKNRALVVAVRNKERTDAVELERVEKDKLLEKVERERVVELARIEKTRAVELEEKSIQDVIRERVMVERQVVEEQERIKDTEAFATADRDKKVHVTAAEKEAEQALIIQMKAAEADKRAKEFEAEKVVIDAEANYKAAQKKSAAQKLMAEADAAECAAAGMADVQVMEAKAHALEKEGTAEANVIQMKAEAEATGIHKKAEAMKLFDEVGRDHEEFRLKLDMNKEIQLAEIDIQKDIATSQASVVAEALKNAKVDIIGGETQFFDKITNAITAGKSVDGLVGKSNVLTNIEKTFFNSDPEYFRSQLRNLMGQIGVTSEDIMNLTIAAALGKMLNQASDPKSKGLIESLMGIAQRSGISDNNVSSVLD
ncbi:MAG: flotillin family protein [Verrucomicrobiota bacterium]